tara:strand:+ start:21509 stop:22105 length:597 start_codon:yes stop_codon:yes gene_type:complete
MIKNLIIDLGGVIIPLAIENTLQAMKALGIDIENYDQLPLFKQFETGEVSEHDFLTAVVRQYPHISTQQFIDSWNAMLLPIPKNKMEELRMLKNKYNLYLLSNTNPVHTKYIHNYLQKHFNLPDFSPLFKKVYYSYECKMRKPDAEFFNLVLTENNLTPHETLFTDDTKEHIESAKKLGIKTFLFNPEKDNLLNIINH